MKPTLLVCLSVLVLPVMADEGMWPFNQFPKDAVAEKHTFDATSDFLDNLRLASLRVTGGSASFVSPNGLVLTNQHIVGGCLAKLSSPQHDYVKDGFYAPTQTAESPCPGLEASVLLSIEDVTQQVKSAAKEDAPAAQMAEQRNAAIAKLEKDCSSKTGNRCNVVKLFSGGRYDLYQFKTYGDLRLVFAPEYDLAFFGRERDSITYLRYGMDVAFLRAYENGKPAATPHYLKWSTQAVKQGDLVFAVGNPELTLRLATAAQLTFNRDTALPLILSRFLPRIQLLKEFSLKSEENLRAAQPILKEFLITYKAAAGKYIGVKDDRLVSRKTHFESKVRHAVERDPKLGEAAGKVWDDVAKAYKTWAPYEKQYQVVEAAAAPGSALFRIARQLVRGDTRSAALDSDEPINDAIEIMLLARYFEELKKLNAKEVPLKSILGSKQPEQAAEAFVKASKLKDSSVRTRLSASRDVARKSDDGMIRLALLLEDAAQKIRKKHDDIIGSLEASATEKIAGYRFALFGAADYPDANGTPRIEFGVVKGYTDRAGVGMPYASSFGGLYYRKDNQGPYQVPQRWVDLKPALELVTPLDFVSTCDLGGGDYGSPTVNRAGELVGVTFDGNIESLPNVFLYTEDQARAVHVSVQGIAEALGKIYQAAPLLTELGVKPGRAMAAATR